jgi:hypothetical protein
MSAAPNTVPEFVTIGGTGHVVREDGWCEALGCWVYRDGRGRLITIPVD